MHKLLKQPRTQAWLLVVGSATLIIGGCYSMVQQSTRLGANELPLILAQTAAHELEVGKNPLSVIPSTQTDLRNDVTPFIIVTDSNPHILASSAKLDGQTPLPPSGVFSYTQSHSADKFSWEPAANVRAATEVIKVPKGFIIAGQSLKPFEDRINRYTQIALLTWVAVVAWTSIILFWPTRPESKAAKAKK